MKDLSRDQRFRHHPKNHKKALRADKEVTVIAGRLVRELECNPWEDRVGYASQTGLFNRVLSRGRNSKDRIYSLHGAEVVCISKGRKHKKYGNKVSVITLIRGVILGALSFRNEYDGHTVDRAPEQVKRITGKTPALLAGDRGYRGQKQSGDTGIEIPGTPKLRDTRCRKQKKRKLFCRRAGIEAGIGHLKSAHRLGRNFYRGLQGDAINIMPATAAFNFKRALCLIKKINETLLEKCLDEICFLRDDYLPYIISNIRGWFAEDGYST